jgi:hypothetical protein
VPHLTYFLLSSPLPAGVWSAPPQIVISVRLIRKGSSEKSFFVPHLTYFLLSSPLPAGVWSAPPQIVISVRLIRKGSSEKFAFGLPAINAQA